MYRISACSLLAGLVVSIALLPLGARAETTQPQTVEQVRAAFVGVGFQADPAISWTWTSPPVTTLRIFDEASGRVLLALVYPDAVVAQAERLRAQAQELPASAPGLDGYGPHLVPGYGPSLWRANVALVQTTQSELDRIFRAQNERDNGAMAMVDTTAIREPSAPTYAVDADFLQALERSVVNL